MLSLDPASSCFLSCCHGTLVVILKLLPSLYSEESHAADASIETNIAPPLVGRELDDLVLLSCTGSLWKLTSPVKFLQLKKSFVSLSFWFLF